MVVQRDKEVNLIESEKISKRQGLGRTERRARIKGPGGHFLPVCVKAQRHKNMWDGGWGGSSSGRTLA